MISEYEYELLRGAYEMSMVLPSERIQDDAYIQQYSSNIGYEPFALMVTRIFNSHAGIGWTTTIHTGTPVAIYAQGVGAEQFGGLIDNTNICKTILSLCEAER